MDAKSAALLLRSLAGRAEPDPATGRHRVGALSALELEALDFAASKLDGGSGVEANSSAATPSGAQEGTVQPAARIKRSPPPGVVFDSARLAAPDDSVTLCLDFGTAKSKAFATKRSASKSLE